MEQSEQELRAEIDRLSQRLDYVVLQLEREAKFMPTWKPETRRFHRAYDCVREVRDDMKGLR